MKTNRFIKSLLVTAGIMSVFFGVAGIFIPVLPTTPFLLLAAFCFSRSSERLNKWLLNNKWFGLYIREYRQGRGIPFSVKVYAISLLWATILVSVIFLIGNNYLRAGLVIIAVAVTAHILMVKNRKK